MEKFKPIIEIFTEAIARGLNIYKDPTNRFHAVMHDTLSNGFSYARHHDGYSMILRVLELPVMNKLPADSKLILEAAEILRGMTTSDYDEFLEYVPHVKVDKILCGPVVQGNRLLTEFDIHNIDGEVYLPRWGSSYLTLDVIGGRYPGEVVFGGKTAGDSIAFNDMYKDFLKSLNDKSLSGKRYALSMNQGTQATWAMECASYITNTIYMSLDGLDSTSMRTIAAAMLGYSPHHTPTVLWIDIASLSSFEHAWATVERIIEPIAKDISIVFRLPLISPADRTRFKQIINVGDIIEIDANKPVITPKISQMADEDYPEVSPAQWLTTLNSPLTPITAEAIKIATGVFLHSLLDSLKMDIFRAQN